MKLFRRAKPAPAPVDTAPRRNHWLDRDFPVSGAVRELREGLTLAVQEQLTKAAPRALAATGQDDTQIKRNTALGEVAISDALFMWFFSQTFIGHRTAAFLAQHWLIDKACTMPAKDAIRQGFRVKLDGDEEGSDAQKLIGKANKRYGITDVMQDYVRKGRIFGIRVAVFKFSGQPPAFYEAPFDIDAVQPGTYEGIKCVDPYWCAPQFDEQSVVDPLADGFYEPTYWLIAGQRYHKSHCCIFRTGEVADILKPAYYYGGIPVPQRIMERVYAAERTANEAPQLAMTKRLTHWKTDLEQLITRQSKFKDFWASFVAWRDNYGMKISDTEDDMQVFDTSLQGLDETIMTQYQIVAAAANVPATKLLGTTPKGFNATGEYEESSYHEELETIQTHDLTPLLDRHLEIIVRTDEALQALGLDLHPEVEWNPLDSPTAKELAETNKAKAETDTQLVAAGAIDGADVRNRIRTEVDSGYYGIEAEPVSPAEAELDDAIAELEKLPGGGGQAPALASDPEAELDAAVADLTATDSFDIPHSAGVILIRPNGDALWLKRRPDATDEPNKWCWPGGRIDQGEKPQDAALRELAEETGIDYGAPISPVGVINGFVVFTAVSVAALEVALNDEHVDFAWRPLNDPPRPLHKGTAKFLNLDG